MLEINKIIIELDPEIRLAAFSLLAPYVTVSDSIDAEDKTKRIDASKPQDAESFFARFDTARPADNVALLAAYLYSQHGNVPFSVEDIKTLAGAVGLIVPDRVDMTLRNSQREGKNLFQSTGRGLFRPTVHGELFFKNSYQVAKGHKSDEITTR